MKRNRFGQAAILSNKDWARLMRSIKNPRYQLLLNIARFTGERWGAILKLRVEDIGTNEITFRAVTRKATPKGKRATRQVPIHPQLREAIAASQLPAAGLLFPSPKNSARPISFQAASRFLQKHFESLGMVGYSTHSTRRSFITHLYRRGCDLKTLQNLTGHRSLQVLSRYIEDDPERKRAALLLL